MIILPSLYQLFALSFMSVLTDKQLNTPEFTKIWKFFDQDKKYKEAQCKRCKRIFELKGSYESVVTSIYKHLKYKHKIVLDEQQSKKLMSTNKKSIVQAEMRKKTKSIYDMYSAKGFQYSWLSYFMQNVPEDDDDIYHQNQNFGGIKDFYHGTQFTDPLKYHLYKRYSNNQIRAFQQALNKNIKLQSTQSLKQNKKQLNEKLTPEKFAQFNARLQIFKPTDTKARRSLSQLQEYQAMINDRTEQQIWQILHSTINQYFRKKKKNKYTTLLSSFKSEEDFKELCSYGYTVYTTHDFRNNFFGFENKQMRRNYLKYGDHIIIITLVQSSLNICLLACQNQSANLCLLGICIFQVYDASIAKKVVDFFANITKDHLPKSIYLAKQSENYESHFNKFIQENELQLKIYKSSFIFNDYQEQVYMGFFKQEKIMQEPIVNYCLWIDSQIKNDKISLKNIFLILPEVEIISSIIENTRCTLTEIPMKLYNFIDDVNFELNFAPKILKHLKKQFSKAQNFCTHKKLTDQAIQVSQIIPRGEITQKYCFSIYFILTEQRWVCNCKKMFMTGLPCCHLMRILELYDGSMKYYINPRWLCSQSIKN